MDQTFTVTVASPDKELYNGTIEQINLPTTGGEIGVRVGHMPVVCALAPGVIEIIGQPGATPEHYAITGGFAEILAHKATVLVLEGEAAESLEEEAILKAQQAAEKAKASAQTEEEFADASALLQKSLAQLKTIKRRKKWRK